MSEDFDFVFDRDTTPQITEVPIGDEETIPNLKETIRRLKLKLLGSESMVKHLQAKLYERESLWV